MVRLGHGSLVRRILSDDLAADAWLYTSLSRRAGLLRHAQARPGQTVRAASGEDVGGARTLVAGAGCPVSARPASRGPTQNFGAGRRARGRCRGPSPDGGTGRRAHDGICKIREAYRRESQPVEGGGGRAGAREKEGVLRNDSFARGEGRSVCCGDCLDCLPPAERQSGQRHNGITALR